VSVKDFGIGIPKESQAEVFRKFYRVEGTARRFQGLGVGLYICFEIIRRHNGKCWLESEVGKGSTFYFSLPIANPIAEN
jgi:signal transduction histidine kinase